MLFSQYVDAIMPHIPKYDTHKHKHKHTHAHTTEYDYQLTVTFSGMFIMNIHYYYHILVNKWLGKP